MTKYTITAAASFLVKNLLVLATLAAAYPVPGSISGPQTRDLNERCDDGACGFSYGLGEYGCGCKELGACGDGCNDFSACGCGCKGLGACGNECNDFKACGCGCGCNYFKTCKGLGACGLSYAGFGCDRLGDCGISGYGYADLFDSPVPQQA